MKTNHPDFDELTQKLNREAKTFPKREQGWCDGCDANIVATNTRCSVCGFKLKTKHRKR